MKTLIALTAIVTLGLWHPNSSRADDLFQLFWRGGYYVKDGTGHIVAVSYSEADVVKAICQRNGVDPSKYVLVFRPNKRDSAVVQLSNGKVLADFLQFTWADSSDPTTGGFADVVNPSGSVIVRTCPIADEYHSLPLGTFFGLELPTRDANGNLTNDSLVGTALYGIPDDKGVVYGIQATGIVFGIHVSTGQRIVDTSGA